MAIKLSRDVEKDVIQSFKRYSREELGQEFGDLKAALLLDFCLKELAPHVYNKAIEDAQAFMTEKTADLGAVCFEELPLRGNR